MEAGTVNSEEQVIGWRSAKNIITITVSRID
jgi:hypothetical protein